MGVRFRKSINLGGGVRVNLSKSGVGYSFGTKGARVTKTAKGKTRTTIGIPNTGLSYVTESGKNKKVKTNKKIIEVNMFSKFNLTEKEIELFSFVLDNIDNLGEEFSTHDVSCMGCVVSNTYYNKLYNKGLFLKPSRGKYKLNVELLSKLLLEDRIKKEVEEKQRIENEKQKKEAEYKRKRSFSVFNVVFSIPMIIFGLLFLTSPAPLLGLIIFIIGIIKFIKNINYLKSNKRI